MAAITCIYKSVTLQAGETFVIPPGGELIGVSDAAAIVSSCDEEIPENEEVCYMFQFVFSGEDAMDEGCDRKLESISFDNIKVDFDTALTCMCGTIGPCGYATMCDEVWNKLQASSIGPLIKGMASGVNEWNAGDQWTLILKMPNIFTNIIATFGDANNFTGEGNNVNSKVTSIAKIVDCSLGDAVFSYTTSGNSGQYYKFGRGVFGNYQLFNY